MKLTFYKYHGTGNDFIIIDNRKLSVKLNTKQIAWLCDRRFGIGADGLMLLQNKKEFDFEMVYFNADGNESSFCGNGSRCIVAFAKELGVIKKRETKFIATDGIHTAKINGDIISIRMNDVKNVEVDKEYYLLNTGSPHYVKFISGVKNADMIAEGKNIRYSNRFKKGGINVNLAEKNGTGIYVRTYERGVEDETLSCGTGVTASALASSIHGISTAENYSKILTRGGELTVHFHRGKGNSFSHIWLEGPATFVFKGEINI
ncbi:MAG: diaminopimelate epimerase [Bacteroidia bacterium]